MDISACDGRYSRAGAAGRPSNASGAGTESSRREYICGELVVDAARTSPGDYQLVNAARPERSLIGVAHD
jgi:hypothetical protein